MGTGDIADWHREVRLVSMLAPAWAHGTAVEITIFHLLVRFFEKCAIVPLTCRTLDEVLYEGAPVHATLVSFQKFFEQCVIDLGTQG
mmetsp:Transcript_10604/g.19883  ORF Transcript_10604/g.19883 Transcript_10604/m.19883 type:complete len:87 (-) Transcript_10604:261-521(-)